MEYPKYLLKVSKISNFDLMVFRRKTIISRRDIMVAVVLRSKTKIAQQLLGFAQSWFSFGKQLCF